MNNIKKTAIIVLAVALCVMIAITLLEICKLSSYENVDAELIDVTVITYSGQARTADSSEYIATYKYTYDGTEYESSARTFRTERRNVGEIRSIYCNPENPVEVTNLYMLTVEGALLIVTGLVFVLLLIRRNVQ